MHHLAFQKSIIASTSSICSTPTGQSLDYLDRVPIFRDHFCPGANFVLSRDWKRIYCKISLFLTETAPWDLFSVSSVSIVHLLQHNTPHFMNIFPDPTENSPP